MLGPCRRLAAGLNGRGIVVYVRRSKTDQDGTAADVRYLKRGCAAALRQLRDRLTVQRSGLRPDGTAQVLGGINGQSIARRLTAAASAAGIEGRITGHSGRVGLAVELTRRGAPEQATGQGGRVEVEQDGCPLQRRRSSRAGRRRYLPVAGARAARRTSGAPHRRPLDAPGRPPGAPGARPGARRRRSISGSGWRHKRLGHSDRSEQPRKREPLARRTSRIHSPAGPTRIGRYSGRPGQPPRFALP